MPSAIRNSPRFKLPAVRLSTLIVSLFLIIMVFISGLSLAIGYYIARQAVEADIERHRQNTKSISALVINSRLQRLQSVIETSVHDRDLQQAMLRRDTYNVGDILSSIYFSQEEGVLSILFADIASSKDIVDVGTTDFDTKELQKSAIALNAFPMTGHLLITHDNDKEIFAIVTRRDVIIEETGRLIGAIYGGFVLNNNISLLSEIHKRTNANVVAIEHGRDVLAAFPSTSTGKLHLGIDETEATTTAKDGFTVFNMDFPIDHDDAHPLILTAGHSLFAVTALQNKYLNALYLFTATIVAIAVLAAYFLSRTTRISTGALASYAQKVDQGEKDAVFEETFIQEFNDIGATLTSFVNALRESESRAQTILNNANAHITIKTTHGRFLFVNDTFAKTWGLEEIDMLGKTAKDVLPYEFADTVSKTDQEVIEKQVSLQFENTIVVHGESLTFLVTKFPLMGLDGKVKSVCSIATDITERKQSELAVREALIHAERANQAKSEFLATMSHEFRTPLNAILGFSELLRSEYLGPLGHGTYSEYAGDIFRSGEQMLSLVNDMLDIAAIEAGKRTFARQEIDIEDVVHTSIKSVEKIAYDGGITLITDIQQQMPEVLADRRSIVQILHNLLSNAVKFTPSGGKITVSARLNANNLAISVADTGIGIPDEHIATVTDPFFQMESDPHIAKLGTGLGLSIVKSLVEASKGTLKLESAPEAGTIVTFTLPVAYANDVSAVV